MKKAADYPRRILVAVSGLSPAILTETLYALALDKHNPFVPTEVHLITTLEGKRRAKAALLSESGGMFYRLCEDYGLSGIAFNEYNIHVIPDQNGQLLEDIVTPSNNESAADFIVNMIRDMTKNPQGSEQGQGAEDSILHVSIAGGRKTMGYYVGYALSLYGRKQDQLSHVLVDEGFEKCSDFFYPTLKSTRIQDREGNYWDSSEARVYLANIPYVRIADLVDSSIRAKDPLLTQIDKQPQVTFSQAVQMAQDAQQPVKLIVYPHQRKLVASGREFDWQGNDSQLAFYIWLLDQTVNKGEPLPPPIENYPDAAYAESYLEIYTALVGNSRSTESTEKSLKDGMTSKMFEQYKSRVKTAMVKSLGAKLAARYLMDNKRGAAASHQIPLMPGQLEIVDSPQN